MKRFIPQYEPYIKSEYIQSVYKQMKSGWIGTSSTTEQFENKIKEITKMKHVISTTSGTMALYLGLCSLDIPKNKTILFPSYTFLAGANVIKHLGYDIKFVDIDPDTLCMNPDKVILDDSVGAVMFVDHNGYVGYDRTKIKQLCDNKNIPFIEDSAQGLGISYAGTLGIFSIFSFSVPKLITTGQGGVIMTNDDFLAKKIKQLRDHGDDWRKDKIHKNIGINLKFNDMAAALGLAQLNNLDEILKLRKSVFDNYRKYIDIIDYDYDSTWMVIHHTNKADKIIEALKLENIQAVKYYKSIPSNPAFFDGNEYPMAEYVQEHCLYLPSSLNLKSYEIKKICKIINEI